METKLSQIQTALRNEDFDKAFSIAAKFFNGLTKDEKRYIEIAHQKGQRKTYEQLGVDVDECIEKAKTILINKYLNR